MSKDGLRRKISRIYYQLWLPRKYGGTFSQRLSWFQLNQGKSPEEIAKLRWSLLDHLLKHAAERVPFYRTAFQKAGISPSEITGECNFARLPLLRREDIQESLESLVIENISRRALIHSSTSGSTGTTTRYYQDSEYGRQNEAMMLRNRRWTGWDYGDAVLRYWGSPIDLSIHTKLRGKIDGLLRNETLVDAYKMSPGSLRDWPNVLERVHPTLIEGYTNSLVVLGEMLLSSGTMPNVKAVISTAETLFPAQREHLEKAFGARVFNRYGTREISTIAHECKYGRLHIIEDWVYVEVVDETGKPVPAGETGQLVVTAFFNRAMPFIRYAIGDAGALADAGQRCECGLPFRWLERVEGRIQDLISLPGGGYATGEMFNNLIKPLPVVRFLVVQTGEEGTKVDIYIVPDEGFDPAMLDSIREKLKHNAPGLDMDFHLVEEIPRMPSEKRRYTISYLSGMDALYSSNPNVKQ